MPSLTIPTLASLQAIKIEFNHSLKDLTSAIRAAEDQGDVSDLHQELMIGMRPSADVRENWGHLIWWSALYFWHFRKIETVVLLSLLCIPVAGNSYLFLKSLLSSG